MVPKLRNLTNGSNTAVPGPGLRSSKARKLVVQGLLAILGWQFVWLVGAVGDQRMAVYMAGILVDDQSMNSFLGNDDHPTVA